MRQVFKCIKLSVVLSVVLLLGCKADSLVIKITAADIEEAVDGEEVTIDFVAEFIVHGELDEEQRAKLDMVSGIAEKYLDLDDIDLSKDGSSSTLTFEGSVPVSTEQNGSSPWYIRISDWDDEYHRVELVVGSDYAKMATEIKAISYMWEPNPYHEAKFKLKAKNKKIIAPVVQVDGDTHLFYEGTVGKSITLNFVGDPFTEAGAGFLLGK